MKFNKSNVEAEITSRINLLQKEYGFDPNNGTSQLRGKYDKETVIAYGKWDAMRSLHFELFGNDKGFYSQH